MVQSHSPHVTIDLRPKTEDRRPKTEDRSPKTEDRRPKTEDRSTSPLQCRKGYFKKSKKRKKTKVLATTEIRTQVTGIRTLGDNQLHYSGFLVDLQEEERCNMKGVQQQKSGPS
jgi:hypothetical protein